MLPSILKNFNVFTDGVSWQGEVDEVTQPKLTRKLEDFRAGGMSGPIPIDMGNEKIEIEVTLGGFVLDAVKKYAATKHDAVMLRFAGAYQNENTGGYDAVEIVVRGRYAEMDFGTAKAGDKSQTKIKMTCSYYKLSVNNDPYIELDFVNMIEIVNGVNILAAQKAAMGL